ncbi:hypothetical protein BDAP_000944 [Binucleata daphniae]
MDFNNDKNIQEESEEEAKDCIKIDEYDKNNEIGKTKVDNEPNSIEMVQDSISMRKLNGVTVVDKNANGFYLQNGSANHNGKYDGKAEGLNGSVYKRQQSNLSVDSFSFLDTTKQKYNGLSTSDKDMYNASISVTKNKFDGNKNNNDLTNIARHCFLEQNKMNYEHQTYTENNEKPEEKNEQTNNKTHIDNALKISNKYANNYAESLNINILDISNNNQRCGNMINKEQEIDNNVFVPEQHEYYFSPNNNNLAKPTNKDNDFTCTEEYSATLLDNINKKYTQKNTASDKKEKIHNYDNVNDNVYNSSVIDNNNYNMDNYMYDANLSYENDNSLFAYENEMYDYCHKDYMNDINTIEKTKIDEQIYKNSEKIYKSDRFSNSHEYDIEKDNEYSKKQNVDSTDKNYNLGSTDSVIYFDNKMQENYHHNRLQNKEKQVIDKDKYINDNKNMYTSNIYDGMRKHNFNEKTVNKYDNYVDIMDMQPNILKHDETALLNRRIRKTKKQPYEYDVTRMYVKGRKLKKNKLQNDNKSNEMGYLNMYTNNFNLLGYNNNEKDGDYNSQINKFDSINGKNNIEFGDLYDMNNTNIASTNHTPNLYNSFDNKMQQNNYYNNLHDKKPWISENNERSKMFNDNKTNYNESIKYDNMYNEMYDGNLYNIEQNGEEKLNFGSFSNDYDPQINTKSEFRYSCDPCMKKFKRLSTLKIHIFSHIKDADIFKCPKVNCDSGFKSQSIAIKHIQHFHDTDKHILIEHLKISKFSSIFRSYTTLLDYYKTYHPNMFNPFLGNFCFGCFTYPRSLKDHPCSKVFYSLTQCPTCRKEIICGELENHVVTEYCIRTIPNVKDFE